MSKLTQKDLSRAEVGDAVRQGILDGDLVAGHRLVEAELCISLGASRGTVRAALSDLVHEGLVEHIPNRGARVRVISLEEALEIAEVRLAVESLCVARAAERITDKEILGLRGIALELKTCADSGNVAGFAQLTHEAFDRYVQIADQPVAAEVLLRLRDRNMRYRFRLSFRSDRPTVSLSYWLDIIEAICDRKPEAAKQALKRHSENVQEVMKALDNDREPLAEQ